MKKVISIPTNDRLFYRQFLELLRSIPPISKLRPKELDVLSEVMYQLNKYSNLADVRNTVVFSTQVRKEMRDNLSLGEDSFNNNLSILRKWKILTRDNNLNPFLENVIYSDGSSLEFIFKQKK